MDEEIKEIEDRMKALWSQKEEDTFINDLTEILKEDEEAIRKTKEKKLKNDRLKYRNRVNKDGNPPKFTAENVTNFIRERVRTDRSENRNHGEGRKAERSVRLISENPKHATRKKQKSAQETTHRTSGDERKGEARNRDRNQEQNKERQPRSGQPQRS